eukprot:scaffold74073_cov74-Phaeocystis_antarctica.AAC.1
MAGGRVRFVRGGTCWAWAGRTKRTFWERGSAWAMGLCLGSGLYDRTGFSSLRSAADQHSHRPAARLGARALAPRHLLRRRFFRDYSLDNCRCHHALRPRPSAVPLRSSRWRAN